MNERTLGTWGTRLFGAALVALALGCLAACGGGSTGDGGQESFTGQIPPDTPGGGGAPPTTGGGGTTPADPPAEDPPAGDPPVEPTPGDPPVEDPPTPREPPIEAPPPPEALESYALGDIHATTVDPRDGTRYLVDAPTGRLFVLRVGQPEPEALLETGVTGVHGLAFDPAAEVFYAAVVHGDIDSDVYRIPLDGVPALVGTVTGYEAVEGLAWHTARGTLYATDTDQDKLITIDTATAAPTEVGPFGGVHEALAGLSCDADDDVLYATDLATADIVAIDPEDGSARRMATLPEGPLDGLGYDPTTRLFFASSVERSRLFMIDARGAWIGLDRIRGLAYDPDTRTLYGSHVGHAILVRIELESGWRQSLGYLGIAMLEGLTWDTVDGALYGVSSATRELYRITPDDASVQSIGTVYGATKEETWDGLSGLAQVGTDLVAVDRATGALLGLSRDDARATLRTTIPDPRGVESLAYDPAEGFLHAFGNEADTHVAFQVSAGYTPVVVSMGLFDAIGGLAWLPDETKLLGTDLPGDAIVTLYRTAPEASLDDEITALARQAGSDDLLGFDLATDAVVELVVADQASAPLATHAGLALEAMADDTVHGVVYGADSASSSLYRVASDGSVVRIGAAGALGANVVRAMAYDPIRDMLWGVDAVTKRLLSIDTDDGEAHVVNPGAAPLPFDQIEAMTWDPDTGALLAVDRLSRSLLEIDADTQTAVAFASIEPTAVQGMVAAPGTGTLLVVDTDLDRIVVIDRFTGATLEPFAGLAAHRGTGGDAKLAAPLWPRGDVRVAGLDTLAIEVSVDYANDGVLVFRRGGKTIFERAFEPEKIVSVERLPEAVRQALHEGDEIEWGIAFEAKDDILVPFRVVEGDDVKTDLEKLASNAYLRRQPALWRDVLDARVLGLHGLHAESLERLLRTGAGHGVNLAVRHGIAKALTGLGDSQGAVQDAITNLDLLGRTLLEATTPNPK